MKYALKQKWFSQGNDFTIVDEKGRAAFKVDGSAFTSGNKLSIRDRDDTELAFINQKILNSGPALEIYHGDDLQAVIKKDAIKGGRLPFRAEAPCPDDLHAEGNLPGREYAFTREGKTVGRVSKTLFGVDGTYGVEVGRGEDEVLLLANAIAIDLYCQKAG